MSCCQQYASQPGGERVFDVDTNRVSYGRGAMAEVGPNAQLLGLRRVAVISDPAVAALPAFARACASLRAAGCEPVVYACARVEPTNESFADAIAFARDARPDGYVSIGGGSAIDTAKAANLYATHAAELLAFVNAPVGEGRAVPGPLAPHIACPTTAGTGSESTGIAIFDHLPIETKTGIASRHLRPTLGLIDPDWTASLPPLVVACAGFDVLAHALESYTARPFTQRSAALPGTRPLAQGANPFSDVACIEALALIGRYLERAVADSADAQAREGLMFAATLAGIGFGSAGVHVPHAMSYAVAGLVRDYHPHDYPAQRPLVPHGMAVILNAPAAVRHSASAAARRHRAAAVALNVPKAAPAHDTEIGDLLGTHLRGLIERTGLPAGLAGVGYGPADIGALVAGTLRQKRLLDNAPVPIDERVLGDLFRAAL